MGEVIAFPGVTTLDLDADLVTSAALGKLDSVVILGYSKDGEEYFASSLSDGGAVNWLLDRMKKALLEVQEREEYE